MLLLDLTAACSSHTCTVVGHFCWCHLHIHQFCSVLFLVFWVMSQYFGSSEDLSRTRLPRKIWGVSGVVSLSGGLVVVEGGIGVCMP